MSFNIAKAISALHHTLLLILVMGFVSLVQAQVIGEDLVLQDMTIGGGEDETYEATNTITTAGENDVGAPTTFVVKAGGRATLKARTRIELKAGTQLELGASFRAYIDPNAGSPTTSPTITILEPDGVDDTADSSYEISWEDEDPNYNASIFLYYDMDNEGEDGTLINESSIDEDDEPNIHIWNTSEVLQGDYYIYGVIDNAESPAVVDYSEGVVSIERNDRPTIGGVPGTSVEEDTAYSFTPTSGDVDEGDDLTFSIVNQPSWASFDEATGRLWGIPGNEDVGVTSDIVITVMDDSGAANDRASLPAFNLTVLNVNDAPVAEDDDRSMPEDGQIWIRVVDNDTDVDDANIHLKIKSFDLESDEGGEVILPQPPNSPPNYRVLRYTPVDHFNGEDGFDYVIEDPAGATSTGRVTITVIAVNDAPDAVDDAYTVEEDSGVTNLPVLSNDTSLPDTGETLTITEVSEGSARGTVEINGGTSIDYTPAGDFDETETFTYTINDGTPDSDDTATVTVVVDDVNDAPKAEDDAATVNEDTSVTIDVLNNDTDPENDPLSIVSFPKETSQGSVMESDGVLIYTPNLDTNGLDSFTYEVSDGNGGTAMATVDITVIAVNDPPRFSEMPATGGYTGEEYSFMPTVTDPEGDGFTLSIVNEPEWAIFDDQTGELSGRFRDGEEGVYEDIQIMATDDSGEPNDTTVLTFDVTVLPGVPAVAPWKFMSSRAMAEGTPEEVTLYFGQHGDTPVACDYDGDGITDLAVWRTYRSSAYGDGPRSMWIIRQSSNDQTMIEYFGDLDGQYPADVPVQADYDGDGRCDMAYLDDTGSGATGNTWHIKESLSGNTVTRNWNPNHEQVPSFDDFRRDILGGEWSATSAVPAPADYDGDGKADLGAFWPYRAAWTYQPSSGGNDVDDIVYGMPGEQIFDYRLGPDTWLIYDLPVPADYIEDGEDKAQPATWRPKDRKWSVQGQPTITIGRGLEIPVTGDFDGDGKADPAVFVQRPDITMEHVSDDITAGGEWEDRQGEISVLDDNGTYRMTYCSSTQVRPGLADDIFYSESSSPTEGFSDPQRIILGSCEHTFAKLPSSINPVFQSQCGPGSVYLLYVASERYDLSDATFHPSGTIWPPPLNEPQDPTLWPTRIGNGPWPWLGLKIVLYSACDNLGNPQSWVRRGPVFEIPVVPGGSHGNPIGISQPQAIYQDGTVYLSVLYDDDIGGVNLIRTHLGVSTDGINFTDAGVSGAKRSNRIHGLDQSNSMIGHTFHSVNDDWRGNQEDDEGYAIEMSSYLHFSKELGNLKTPSLKNQYKHVDHLLKMPKTKDCSYAPGVMESPHGFVEGNSTYVYAPEWDYEYYCTCRVGRPTGFNDPDNPEEPDMCNHALRDNGTWSLETGEIGVSRVDFNFIETDCIGNRYSSCADGSCTGAQRMRTCTAEDTWGDWVDLE